MAVVAACRAALIGVLGLAVLLDFASIVLLYVVFFLIGAGETLFDTASATVLPAVVPRDQLPKANARLSGTMTVTNQFVGPPLGGFLFATAAALPFLVGAGGLAAAAALILALRGTFKVARADDAPPANLRVEIVEGIRWLWGHRLLRTLALALALLNVTVLAQVSVMVLFAQERLGLGPEGFGVLLTTYGLGGLLGSVVAPRVIARLGAGRTLRLAMVIETVTPAAIALTTSPLLVGAELAFFGCHAVVWGVLLSSLRQELTPARLQGRVTSAYRLLEHGGAATGLVLMPLVWSTFSEAAVAAARKEAHSARSEPRP